MKANNSTGVGVKLVVFQLGVDLFAADVLVGRPRAALLAAQQRARRAARGSRA